jgi:hypothetical protein
MTKRLVSKVKVVLSLTSILLFFIIISPSQAQSVQDDVLQKKLTLTFEQQRFEDVLQNMERQTKLHFVYSSNKIELNRRVSFAAFGRPLHEIFTSLGKLLDLEFKKQGDYVTVKKLITSPGHPPMPKESPVTKNTEREANTPTETEFSAPESIEPEKMVALSDNISYKTLMKNLVPGSAPDTEFLRQLLLNPNNNLHQHRNRLFISAGLFGNDYSGGSEFRFGIRSLYAVVNASLFKNGTVRTGYGVGSSIALRHKFTLNPVYTFAPLKTNIRYDGDLFHVNAQHHQLKFIIQYPLTKHFTFQAGPSFNFMKATYTLELPPHPYELIRVTNFRGPSAGTQSYDRSNTFYPMPLSHSASPAGAYTPVVEFLRVKTWVGFEVGFSYSINFSRRP